jgi:hypothetical protein
VIVLRLFIIPHEKVKESRNLPDKYLPSRPREDNNAGVSMEVIAT